MAKTVKKTTKNSLVIPLYDIDGTEKGSIEVPEEIKSAEVSLKLLAQYVRVYLANQRQGNASTKTRSEVVGSTKKIYRQKGTGRARHGARKASLFIGGGVTFGPKPRDFSMKLNKKQKRKALLGAFFMKIKEKGITGLSSAFLDIEPKTKLFAEFLKKSGIQEKNKSMLLIMPGEKNSRLDLAARNVSRLEVMKENQVNPYILMKYRKILLFEDSLKHVVSRFTQEL